jgi:hypothetical protein
VLGSGSSWSVPADWNNSNNVIECIGGGAGGSRGAAGGGGAYSRATNAGLPMGRTVAYNIGLLLMLALNIFPAGIYQLVQSIQHGFWYARSEAVIQSTFFQVTTWSRVVGDMVFVLGGAVPIAYFMVTRLFSLRPAK